MANKKGDNTDPCLTLNLIWKVADSTCIIVLFVYFVCIFYLIYVIFLATMWWWVNKVVYNIIVERRSVFCIDGIIVIWRVYVARDGLSLSFSCEKYNLYNTIVSDDQISLTICLDISSAAAPRSPDGERCNLWDCKRLSPLSAGTSTHFYNTESSVWHWSQLIREKTPLDIASGDYTLQKIGKLALTGTPDSIRRRRRRRLHLLCQ